ncbi:MAG TPA: NusG domain II-containing protein [Candidatus Limiplasma sp.]|nr:NusG domain II-containing protein [Candidatus Limiplasma sp.]
MKRRDFIILAIVLVASLVLFLLRPKAIVDGTETAYLHISVPGQTDQWIPLTEEREIRIEQDNGDYNVVEIFPGGFRMVESNCPNQDCIKQGDVTVDNIGDRVLGNEIICLPHKLVLSLETEAGTAQENDP